VLEAGQVLEEVLEADGQPEDVEEVPVAWSVSVEFGEQRLFSKRVINYPHKEGTYVRRKPWGRVSTVEALDLSVKPEMSE